MVRGLKTFVLDPDRNPGAPTSIASTDGSSIDYAHNEAGMIGLTEVLHGLKRSDCEVWLAICTAGDRTDRILHGFAFRAAVGSDHLAVAELIQYLRGRSRDDIIERLREGAREAGVEDVPVYADELAALQAMVATATTGDVVGVTALGMRPEIFAWLEANGGERMGPADVRRIVKQARTSPTAASDAPHP